MNSLATRDDFVVSRDYARDLYKTMKRIHEGMDQIKVVSAAAHAARKARLCCEVARALLRTPPFAPVIDFFPPGSTGSDTLRHQVEGPKFLPLNSKGKFTMRQSAVRWLYAGLACSATFTFPSLAGAAVVWTATFETGTLSEWRGGVNLVQPNGTRKNAEVLGEQVYSGKFAGKITVHPDDTFTFGQNRADIGHPSTLTAQGTQVWLSGHYMMPEDAKTRMEFAFFESNTSFLNAMDFWVEPRMGGGTNIVYGVGDLGRTVVWTGNFTIGVWHQVAIHVLWSTSATVGTVDVWFDGVQVVTDRKAQTSRDTNTLFFETGLHRRTVGNVAETIYLDDFIEADNFADAKIATPIGSDAGVGDASNTGAGGSGAGGADGAAMDGGTSAGGTSGAGTGGATGVTGTTGSATTGTADGSTTSPATTGTGSGAAPHAGSGCSCGVLTAGDDVPKWWAGALLLAGAIAARLRRRS